MTDLQAPQPNDGGPAFPHPDYLHAGPWGMTLRDYFAAQAFPGLLSGATWDDVRDGADECARAAYALADSMLKVRGGAA